MNIIILNCEFACFCRAGGVLGGQVFLIIMQECVCYKMTSMEITACMIIIMQECVCYKMTSMVITACMIIIMQECVCYKMTSMEITACI